MEDLIDPSLEIEIMFVLRVCHLYRHVRWKPYRARNAHRTRKWLYACGPAALNACIHVSFDGLPTFGILCSLL